MEANCEECGISFEQFKTRCLPGATKDQLRKCATAFRSHKGWCTIVKPWPHRKNCPSCKIALADYTGWIDHRWQEDSHFGAKQSWSRHMGKCQGMRKLIEGAMQDMGEHEPEDEKDEDDIPLAQLYKRRCKRVRWADEEEAEEKYGALTDEEEEMWLRTLVEQEKTRQQATLQQLQNQQLLDERKSSVLLEQQTMIQEELKLNKERRKSRAEDILLCEKEIERTEAIIRKRKRADSVDC